MARVEIRVEHFIAGEAEDRLGLCQVRPAFPSISYCANHNANRLIGKKIILERPQATGFSLTMVSSACILPTIGVDHGLPKPEPVPCTISLLPR